MVTTLVHHSKTWVPSKQQPLSHQLWTVLSWASCIALGGTAGKHSGCIGGEEEHKHDLLVQGSGHLAGKEVAWLLLSAPRAVFISYPMSGNIIERLLGAGTGPMAPPAHRLLTSSCLLLLSHVVLIPHWPWLRVSSHQVRVSCFPDKCFHC